MECGSSLNVVRFEMNLHRTHRLYWLVLLAVVLAVGCEKRLDNPRNASLIVGIGKVHAASGPQHLTSEGTSRLRVFLKPQISPIFGGPVFKTTKRK